MQPRRRRWRLRSSRAPEDESTASRPGSPQQGQGPATSQHRQALRHHGGIADVLEHVVGAGGPRSGRAPRRPGRPGRCRGNWRGTEPVGQRQVRGVGVDRHHRPGLPEHGALHRVGSPTPPTPMTTTVSPATIPDPPEGGPQPSGGSGEQPSRAARSNAMSARASSRRRAPVRPRRWAERAGVQHHGGRVHRRGGSGVRRCRARRRTARPGRYGSAGTDRTAVAS